MATPASAFKLRKYKPIQKEDKLQLLDKDGETTHICGKDLF
jgi:hypothetical protein